MRALLLVMFISATGIAILMYRANSRLEAITTLRDNGGIVETTQRNPWFLGPLKNLDWGGLFTVPQRVDFYVQVEGNRVRIKDRLYEPESAKQFLLQQKSIALGLGATEFQLRAAVKTGSNQEQQLRHNFALFAMDNLDSLMTWDWSTYKTDWENQQLSTR